MNQLKAGAFLSYLSIFLSIGVSFIYTPFMLRSMGQSEYGLFSLALNIVSYLSLMDFGFGAAIVRYTSLHRQSGDGKVEELYGLFFKMYTIIGIVCLIMGLALFLLTPTLFSESLSELELSKLKIIILIIVVYLSLSFPFSVFGAIITSYERFVFLKSMNILRSLLVPIIMIPLLLLGYKSITMTLVTAGVGIIISILNVYYCFNILKIKFTFNKSDKTFIVSILSFSLLVFGKDFFERITWSSGQFILGINMGAVAVSIFAIAVQIKGYYETFSKTITNLFLPRVVSFLSTENFLSHFQELFIKIGRIQFHLLSYILVIYLLVGRNFINLWAGKNYDSAYNLSLWIIIPYSFPLIQSLGGIFLQAINKLKVQLYIYIVEAILVLLCSLILPNYIGIYSAAVSLTIGIVVAEIILANVYWRILRIDIWKFWLEIFKIIVPVSIFLLISRYLISHFAIVSYSYLLFAICLITIPYFLFTYVFTMNKYEKHLIFSTIKKIYRR